MPAHGAHWIGTFGELLNFVGALILARDLFLRRREAADLKRLNRLAEWGRKHNVSAVFESVPVSDPEFTEKVQGRRASLLGYWGIGFMALGFLALVAYHLIDIYHGE
jgi:hypothetical protein